MTTEFKQGQRVVCFPGTEDERLAVVDGAPVSRQMAGMVRVIFDNDGEPGLVEPSEIAHVTQRPQSSRTIRDEFAMAAPTGFLSDSQVKPSGSESHAKFIADVAEAAYQDADAMMEARK
jgi:hypothetical protein